ncbi:hypothetical protein [Corynebacterium minutissimum]|uniref:Uncharacterized protein n=1 Tax=Corynebacterium minutissimum TaxID=38301 RepID=A0A376CW67_9CORY|nr:hypothetical protein [Corynebacterium minutissimum]QRP60665.1 hypothetical protein I6J26_11015 [Corynebacterium minutissimum]STC76745.1 Uncharacterised protein [Corynebacterium minutissimum]
MNTNTFSAAMINFGIKEDQYKTTDYLARRDIMDIVNRECVKLGMSRAERLNFYSRILKNGTLDRAARCVVDMVNAPRYGREHERVADMASECAAEAELIMALA